MKSERTKRLGFLSKLFTFFHLVLLMGPLLYFVPYGYITGKTTEKIAMSFTIIASVFLLVTSIMVDVKHRAGLHKTIMWLLVIGCMITLDRVRTLIYLVAIASVIDELVIIPLRDSFRLKKKVNKEIDLRG
jgi:FtsH-binding integral membrane protein